MSVTANPSRDWTAAPARGFARSSNAAVLTSRGGPVQTPGTPSLSDPSTGALAQWPPALLPPKVASNSIPNPSSFWFVVGLLVVTIWLESGKRGSIV